MGQSMPACGNDLCLAHRREDPMLLLKPIAQRPGSHRGLAGFCHARSAATKAKHGSNGKGLSDGRAKARKTPSLGDECIRGTTSTSSPSSQRSKEPVEQMPTLLTSPKRRSYDSMLQKKPCGPGSLSKSSRMVHIDSIPEPVNGEPMTPCFSSEGCRSLKPSPSSFYHMPSFGRPCSNDSLSPSFAGKEDLEEVGVPASSETPVCSASPQCQQPRLRRRSTPYYEFEYTQWEEEMEVDAEAPKPDMKLLHRE